MIFLSPDAATDIERVRDFLDINNPEAAKRALRTIFAALEHVQEFPELGRPTQDPHIRQIVIRFGAAGYVLRDTILPESNDILVLRLWHGPRGADLIGFGFERQHDSRTPNSRRGCIQRVRRLSRAARPRLCRARQRKRR